jgi:hypothetical protein
MVHYALKLRGKPFHLVTVTSRIDPQQKNQFSSSSELAVLHLSKHCEGRQTNAPCFLEDFIIKA